MFKFIAIVALCSLAAVANAGLIQTHHVLHEPVVAKVGTIVHSSPSAVSHQSITQVHSKAVVQPIVAPIVKTTIHSAPVLHAAPVVHHVAPVVHSVHAAPLVHSVPVVHSSPVVHSVHAAPLVHSVPVVHSAPLLKTVVHPAPLTYTLHH